MNRPEDAAREAFLRNGAKRNAGGCAWRTTEFRHPAACCAQGWGAEQWAVRPSMSSKCRDSHHMKEFGCSLCFLASGGHRKILPGLYFLEREPARRQALGTQSSHYASKY